MAETLATTFVIWGKYTCTPDTETYKYYTQSEWDVDEVGQVPDGDTITGYYNYGLDYDGSDQRYEYNENVSLTLTTLTAPQVGTVYNVHSYGLEVWYEKFYNNSEDGTVHLQRGRRYITTHTGTRDVYLIGSKLGTIETENGAYPEYIYVATEGDYIIMTDGSSYYAFLEEGVVEEQIKSPGAYIGVATEFPVYETQGTTQVDITSEALLEEYFTVNNGSNGFAWVNSENRFQNHNGSDESSIAIMKLTALKDTDISFDWGCDTSTDENCFYVYVNRVQAVYGEYDDSGSYSCSLKAGENIEFQFHFYAYGYSDDYAYFKNLRITIPNIVQIGTEIKGIARKVEKGYIGIDAIARRIYKAYIGVGGVARPCWGVEKLTYYGTTPADLTYYRYNHAAAAVDGVAMFFGGRQLSGAMASQTEAYDKNLVKLSSGTSYTGTYMAATALDKFIIVAGGYNSDDTAMSTATRYNSSITRQYLSTLHVAAGHLAATTVGNYALFGGGQWANQATNKIVTAFDQSGARLSEFYLKTSAGNLAATTVGDYALFGGGHSSYAYTSGTSGDITNSVTCFDSSLTEVASVSPLSVARQALSAVTVDNYALFAGGYPYSQVYRGEFTTVDAYDTSLTRYIATPLTHRAESLAATTLDNGFSKYAIFAGGNTYNNTTGGLDSRAYVEFYDAALTKTLGDELVNAKGCNVATTVGNYALFSEGKKIDVYTLSI